MILAWASPFNPKQTWLTQPSRELRRIKEIVYSRPMCIYLYIYICIVLFAIALFLVSPKKMMAHSVCFGNRDCTYTQCSKLLKGLACAMLPTVYLK